MEHNLQNIRVQKSFLPGVKVVGEGVREVIKVGGDKGEEEGEADGEGEMEGLVEGEGEGLGEGLGLRAVVALRQAIKRLQLTAPLTELIIY